MGWINNLKVAYKILILVVIAAIAMVTIGYQGYTAISKANDDMDIMYNQKLQSMYRLGEQKFIVRDIQTRAVLSMSAKDAARFKELHDDMTEAQKNFDENLAEFGKVAGHVPGVAERIDKVQADGHALIKLMNDIIVLNETGKAAEAQELYSKKGGKATSDLRKQIEELQEMARSNSEKIYNQNDAESDAAARNMLIQCLVALLTLVLISTWISREVTSPLRSMMEACAKLRDGDFRDMPRTIMRGDEFGEMADVVAAMRTSLNKLMHQTHSSSEQIAASSEELTASSAQSANASTQVAQSVVTAAEAVQAQQQGVDTSAGSVKKVSTAVDTLREEAGKVAQHASAAFERAVSGSKAIHASVEQIKSVETTVGESAAIVDKLGERSQEIGQIVETIAGISGQTNLLALNAAIEAARAGEHGRGFAVVAEEVRKLAEQSQTAAQQIADLITGIQSDTAEAVNSMQEGSRAVSDGAQSVEGLRENFDEIRVFVDEVSKEVNQMAEAIKRVAADTANIAREVANIDAQGHKVADEMQSVSAATEEQSASAEEIASASDALANLAQELQESLAKFRF